MNGLSVGNIKNRFLVKRTCFFMPDGLPGERKMIAGKVALRRGRRLGIVKLQKRERFESIL